MTTKDTKVSGNKSRERYETADELGTPEILRLGEFVLQLARLLRGSHHPLPDLIRDAAYFQAALTCDSPDLGALGEGIREAVASELFTFQPSLEQGQLFWEALIEAMNDLHGGQVMREHAGKRRGHERADVDPPPVRAISLAEVAQAIIDNAFGDGFEVPSSAEQSARVELALLLDPQNSDAFLITGELAEQSERYQEARAAYEQAMELAAEKLGPGAFDPAAIASGRIVFWGELKTRSYMRARQALAYLLWRRLGMLQEAIAHFTALLALNPRDNQGNRDALLCALAEAGDVTGLEAALSRYHYYDDGTTGEHIESAEACWHYTHALHLFEIHRDVPGLKKATAALRQAFQHNAFVPLLLLDPASVPDLDDLGGYKRGDATEAAWYVGMALAAWKRVLGALDWLENIAWKEEGLLPRRDEPPRKITFLVLRQPEKRKPGREEGAYSETLSAYWRGPVLSGGLTILRPIGLERFGRKLPDVPSIALLEATEGDQEYRGDLSLQLPGAPGSAREAQLVGVTFVSAPGGQGEVSAWPTAFVVRFSFAQPGVPDLWQAYTIRYSPERGRPVLVLIDRRHDQTDPARPPDNTIYGKDFPDGQLYYGVGDHYWLSPDSGYGPHVYGTTTRHDHLPRGMLACLQGLVTQTLPRLEVYCDWCGAYHERNGLFWCQHIWWCVTCRRVSTPLVRSRKYARDAAYRCSHRALGWFSGI